MKTNIGVWRQTAFLTVAGNRDENSITINAILKKVLKRDQAWILANPDYELSPDQITELDHFSQRLTTGEPLPYILGEAEFFGYPFFVNPDVLIPRPETELLVEHVISWINQYKGKDPIQLLDIGTGSGCIPISVFKTNPEIKSFAVDISGKALKVAKKNAEKHKLKTLNFIQTNLISAIEGKFQIVTANLPYIPSETYSKLRVAKHEPALALDGGKDGLMLYRQLFDHLPSILAQPALCICEIHHDQGLKILEMAKTIFQVESISIDQDYAGFDRFLKIEV